jgi:hypothetical protein
LEKTEGKGPLGSPRHEWADYIKKCFRDENSDGMEWINLDQDRNQWNALANVETNLRVLQDVKNFLSG